MDHQHSTAAPAAAITCVDCGDAIITARDRCKNCYYRHLGALKANGEFVKVDVSRPLLDRIMEKTTPGYGGCVIFTGRVNRKNYGVTSVQDAPGKQRQVYAHRSAYQILVGPIPDGMQVDHTCHNRDASCPGGDDCMHRRCVNPHHLEAVPPRENQRRSHRTFHGVNSAKTHCINGHAFDEANTYIRPDNGARQCKQCGRDRRAAATTPSQADEALRRVREEEAARRSVDTQFPAVAAFLANERGGQ